MGGLEGGARFLGAALGQGQDPSAKEDMAREDLGECLERVCSLQGWQAPLPLLGDLMVLIPSPPLDLDNLGGRSSFVFTEEETEAGR